VTILALQLEDHGGATAFMALVTSDDTASNPAFTDNDPPPPLPQQPPDDLPETSALALLGLGLLGVGALGVGGPLSRLRYPRAERCCQSNDNVSQDGYTSALQVAGCRHSAATPMTTLTQKYGLFINGRACHETYPGVVRVTSR